MNKYYSIALILVASYVFLKIARVYLFHGFSPIVNLRLSQAQAIVAELSKEKIVADPIVYSLGSGTVGFLSVLSQALPNAKLFGIQNNLGLFVINKLQLLSKFSPIRLKWQKRLYSLKFDEVDLVYCDLSLEDLTELPRKLKYECRAGTIVLSIGIPIPNLEEKRGFDLPPLKTLKERLFFWRHNTAVTASKVKGSGWVYLYEI